MKRRLLAVCLIIALLLGGCGGQITFRDMQYSRPDMAAYRLTFSKCMETAPGERNLENLVDLIYDCQSAYTAFYTNYMLAYIHYSMGLNDLYWEREYTYCAENAAQMDEALDSLYRTLADCPLRQELEGEDYFGADFFCDYEGDSYWDDAFTALLEQEAELENRYYALQDGEDYGTEEFAPKAEQLYVELVKLRQDIAKEAGYESYPEYACREIYQRDYTQKDTQTLIDGIKTELVPLYKKLCDAELWECPISPNVPEGAVLYVKDTAKAMGGVIRDAFSEMTDKGLYHMEYREHQFDGSFEVYLYDYQVPFVFVNPSYTVMDYLTFAHEFGHFCNDYAACGSGVNIDVAEVFSQGMEYLSLCYADEEENMTRLKMIDSLCIYAEQAAYADFEQQVYTLSEEELTAENLRVLYDKTCTEYGLDSEFCQDWDYVLISHFFTSPLYIISYVVSNDAALQFYQLEKTTPGAGVELYTNALTTETVGFLEFIKETNLQSPFAPGRMESLKPMFREILHLQ